MPDPSETDRDQLPMPHGDFAGNGADEGAEKSSFGDIAVHWTPRGATSEPPVATVSRYAQRLINRKTGAAYSADELPVNIRSGRPLNATKAFNWIIYGTPSNGQTINVNGRTLTKGNNAVGNRFSSIAELVTKINQDAALYAYVIDTGSVIYVEARVAGAAGNSIILSSATFRCYYANLPAPAPGHLVEGVNGTPAKEPTLTEDQSGNIWFTSGNALSGANWKRIAMMIDTVRPNGNLDFVGSRAPSNLVGSAGDLVLRYYNDPFGRGFVKVPGYSDGVSPMGRCVVPAFGQKTYTAGDFWGGADPLVGFPMNAELAIIGAKLRLFGTVFIKFGADLPDIWLTIIGSTQTNTDHITGLSTDLIPASTGIMRIDLDVDIVFKNATGKGPQGYESYYYLDVAEDRSIKYSGAAATPSWGVGFIQRSSPVGANHHEPCGSSDKEVSFGLGHVPGTGTEVTSTSITCRLYWDVIPPAVWKAD